jgi:hypothetical protein
MRRLLLWRGLDEWRAEAACVELDDRGLRATGTQLGVDPLPYRLDYELDASDGFVTQTLEVEATGGGWTRSLRLERDGGAWRCEAEEDGEAPLPPAGGPVDGLQDALDCDLGFSPLTNMMPIRRHALHEGPGSADFVMAWVAVPDLSLHASAQRYEHVCTMDDGAIVRFVDRGLFEGFTAELELDADALVRVYPGLARRVEGAQPGAGPQVPLN